MPNTDKIQWPQGQPQFEVHWRAIAEALGGNGVVSPGDLEVTSTANDLEIQVGAGTAFYEGSSYTLGSASTFTLTAGDATYDRWDTVYFDTATASAGVREGTAESKPDAPDIQGDEILLATVYVPSSASNVTDSEILNWRTHSSDADNTYVKDPDDHFDNTTVEGALVEAKNETGGSLTDTLNLPDNPGSFGPAFDALIDSNSSAGTGHSYYLALGGTNFAEIYAESDGSGGIQNSAIRLHQIVETGDDIQTSGGTTIWDSTNGWVPNEQVQALTNFTGDESFSGYPLTIGTDVNNDLAGGDLLDSPGGNTVFDSTNGHVPRAQVDDQLETTTVSSATYTTSDEESILVDTAAIAAASTITLASADVAPGNVIAVGDLTGSASTYPITVDTEGSETINGDASVTLGGSNEARVFISDGNNWNTLAASFSGVEIQDAGGEILAESSGINFGTALNVTDDGDNTVTVDADLAGKTTLASGTFTHTGGSSTEHIVESVTTDQTKNLHVEVGVDSDPAFTADYGYDYERYYHWDDANQEVDVEINATWSTDPGSGNDVVLDYEIYEIDDTATLGVGVDNNGTAVGTPARSIDFGTGLIASDDGDGTVTVEGSEKTTIPVAKLTTSDGSTDINQNILFPWDSAPIVDTGTFSYDGTNSPKRITVDEAGTYEIQVNIGIANGGSARDNPNAYLYKNRSSAGSGGTQLDAAGKSGYIRQNDGHRESSLNVSWIGDLNAGDYIVVDMRREAQSGSRPCVPNETNMYIKKIPRP